MDYCDDHPDREFGKRRFTVTFETMDHPNKAGWEQEVYWKGVVLDNARTADCVEVSSVPIAPRLTVEVIVRGGTEHSRRSTIQSVDSWLRPHTSGDVFVRQEG